MNEASAAPAAASSKRVEAKVFASARADRLFLVFAGLAGVTLLALIPPLAGGNERYNFQRVAMIAAGHFAIERAEVPGGVPRLLETNHKQFPQGRPPPYAYSSVEFDALATIPLDAEHTAILEPNPIAILNPAAYIPQVLAYWAGLAFGLGPLTLFYLCRVAGLIAGLALTFLAIRAMPQRALGLAAIALLPPIVFSRATLDADQVTNGLAFLFVALTAKAALEHAPMTPSRLAALAAVAFLEAQCKTAYFVLLPLALAIPVARFGSRARWLAASALIILPGVVASLIWMVSLKHGYFAGAHYHTWAGDADPDAQTSAILGDPIGYLRIVAHTLIATPLAPTALIGLIGIFGPPVVMPVVSLVATGLALALTLAGEGAEGTTAPTVGLRALAALAFFAGVGLILTLLYVQWTGLGALTIEGFSGRYLYPLLPGLLLFLPETPVRLGGVSANAWLAALGAISLASVLFTTWTTYWR